jgi:hypothetical protein
VYVRRRNSGRCEKKDRSDLQQGVESEDGFAVCSEERVCGCVGVRRRNSRRFDPVSS